MKIDTLAELVFKVIPHYNKPDCLMTKKGGVYTNISAHEVVESVESLAAKLMHLGVKKGDRIGLLSENRFEWAYADLAILSAGAITVPIYSTLPAKQVEYILNNSEMVILFVSNELQLNKILEVRAECPLLKTLIVFDPPAQMPPGVLTFDGSLKEGNEYLQSDPTMVQKRAAENKPDDVFTIVYTSGTTGEPKGVMLTHRNVLSNVEAILQIFKFNDNDIALSFLPLCHILERMAGYYTMLHEGATIAYAESIEAMPKNLGEVRPTILISVPRVYEKFYTRIMDNVAAEHGFKKTMATWALRVGAEYADTKTSGRNPSASLALKYAIANKLVFTKIRGRLGGRLRILLSGGAALPRQLGDFFYGLGLTILEGYGLTETSPVIAVNRPDHFKFGTVGPVIPGVEAKIAEDGEILTRGPHVMKGYYKKPAETAEVMTSDGWFKTGDMGEFDADGFLRITDRKKDLLKTSGGKFIAPQFVENALKTSKYVAQIVVIGDKRKFPSALVVPNMENLKKYAAASKIPEEGMLTNSTIVTEVKRDLDNLSKDLAPFERVKKIALLDKEFTVDSGELTPSLKVKRNVVEKKYKDLIDSLYSEPAEA
jgi:long-chain acyl-CoA synthetase